MIARAQVHWLCVSSDVSATLLDAVFEAHPLAAKATDNRGFLPLHYVAANDAATAEVVLVVLEAYEAAASRADHYGQLPLHWRCTSASDDERSVRLLSDSHPAAATQPDRHGCRPLHTLCKNPHVDDASLGEVLRLAPSAAAMRDNQGCLPLHHLCRNPSVTAALLEVLLEAHGVGHAAVDNAGHTPMHLLVRSMPEASDTWTPLLRRAEASGGAGALGGAAGGAPGGTPSKPGGGAMPIMLAADGAVSGILGKVKGMLRTGDVLETRPEDRGLLLFTSSMSAVKVTAQDCKAVRAREQLQPHAPRLPLATCQIVLRRRAHDSLRICHPRRRTAYSRPCCSTSR